MFGVNKGAGAALFLCLCNNAQGQRGFTGAFRAVNFDNPAARHAADAKRNVDADGAGGNSFDIRNGIVLSEAHDRTFAESFFDLAQGRVKCFIFIHSSVFHSRGLFCWY